MHYFYAALIGFVSILAVALSAKALHHWDNLGPPEVNPPWWRTWKRPAFSITVAFLLGALAELSNVWAPTGSLFALTYAVMPLLYWRIRVGLWSYEFEELAMWSAWLCARLLLGGVTIALLPLALALWLPGAIFGGWMLKRLLPQSGLEDFLCTIGRKAKSD